MSIYVQKPCFQPKPLRIGVGIKYQNISFVRNGTKYIGLHKIHAWNPPPFGWNGGISPKKHVIPCRDLDIHAVLSKNICFGT